MRQRLERQRLLPALLAVALSGPLALLALPAAAEGQGTAAISDLTPYVSEVGASGKIGALNIRPIGFQSEIEVDTRSAFSARENGVRLGVRYATPASQGLGTPDLRLNCAVCTSGNIDWLAPLPGSLELGVNYASGTESLRLELAGSYFAAEPEKTAISIDAARSWGVGGRIGFKLPGGAGDLALGGSYSTRNYVNLNGAAGKLAGILTDDATAWAWDAGLSYAYGSWMLGGYYQTTEVDVASALASQLTSLSPGLGGRAIAVQGGYRITPGFALSASVEFWDYQRSALHLPEVGGDRLKQSTSTVVFLETALDF